MCSAGSAGLGSVAVEIKLSRRQGGDIRDVFYSLYHCLSGYFLSFMIFFLLNVMEKSSVILKPRDRGLCKFHVNSVVFLEDSLMC